MESRLGWITGSVRGMLVIKRSGLAAGLLALAPSVWPCCGAGPVGHSVIFGDQTNIIIWDEAHQTEHFIRDASFFSTAKDFGFIAPTPSKPDLHEASVGAFETLANLKPHPFFGAEKTDDSSAPTKSGVDVVQEIDVAGFHAATLLSTDAHAINNWLKMHAYVSTPDVEKWASHYTSKGWYLTAFKVNNPSKDSASTGIVRMSFKTDHPFNPYYVPSSNIEANEGGTLQVYFVSIGDYDGTVGTSEAWREAEWRVGLPDSSRVQLAGQLKLPLEMIPNGAEVASFVDHGFPRVASDDIFFTKKPAPPIGTKLVAPLAGIFTAAAVFYRMRRRRLRAAV